MCSVKTKTAASQQMKSSDQNNFFFVFAFFFVFVSVFAYRVVFVKPKELFGEFLFRKKKQIKSSFGKDCELFKIIALSFPLLSY